MQFAVGFGVRRTNLAEVFPCLVATAQYCFANNHPRIVMAEDTGILFISGRIRRDFTILYLIFCKGRIVQYDTMFAIQTLFHRVERLFYHTLFQSNTGHGTPSLTFDKDLSLFVLFRTHFVSKIVVCTEVPIAIPAMLLHGFYHSIDISCSTFGLIKFAHFATQFHIITSAHHKQACNHQRFGLRALCFVFGCLERFVWIPREAVQVQAVVPVGTANQWQHVRSQIFNNMIERNVQVLHQCNFTSRLVIERHHFIENREVARLLDIGHRTKDEPHGVVVKSATNTIVAAFGQGLILMIASTIGELRRGNVDDTFACSFRYLMHKAHQVLI